MAEDMDAGIRERRLPEAREAEVRAHFTAQARACRALGSPFTARLLDLLSARLDRGHPLGDVVLGWLGDPVADALALRLAGALHALVLSDADRTLATVYPPAEAGDSALSEAVMAAFRVHGAYICDWLERPPQTNEVARSAALLVGYAALAARMNRPLVISEIGASAGLNLLWDRFHYRFDGQEWGDPAATVRLAPHWQGPPLDLPASLRVRERRGCDIHPLDPSRPEDRLRLIAYVWADQTERKARLAAALTLAASAAPSVDRADAADWLAGRLASAPRAAAHVVAHTIVWQYLAGGVRTRVKTLLADAGEAASANRPLAWLRLEPNRDNTKEALILLTLWPGGLTSRLAAADYHGRWIRRTDAAPA